MTTLTASSKKIGRYLRLRRNPLLDRKDFFGRNQEEGEYIDQYVAFLVRINNRCAYDDDIQTRCTQCRHACDHSSRLKECRIRDRLIFGPLDPGMQRRITLEDFGRTSPMIAFCRFARPMSHRQSQA